MGANKRDNIDVRFGAGLGEHGLLRLDRRPQYCGLRMRVGSKTYVSAYTHAALALGQPYGLTYGYTTGQEVVTVAPATLAAPVEIVVPYQAEVISKICWLQTGGRAWVKMDGGTNIAAGNFLSVTVGETAFTYEGTSLAKDSKAVSRDTYEDSADLLREAVLIDKLCEIT